MPRKAAKPRLKAAERREALLLAAKDIFLVEGYERTTMRRIAASLGITPTTLYLHFPDKAALMQAICDEAFAELGTAITRATVEARTPLDAFRAVFDAYVAFGLAHPREYRLVFMTEPPPEASAHRPGIGRRHDPEDRGARAFAGFQALVRRLIETGVFYDGDATTMAEAAWAAVHGLVALLIGMPDYPPAERAALADTVARMVAEGLVKR
ncbi:MAG: TetR/AcrR family transcriptional regulator [Tagaea sp.]